jgi:hypothetical protein
VKEIITTIHMWCDIHGQGTEGTETHNIGLDGKVMEIDVCDECVRQLRSQWALAVKNGRKPMSQTQTVGVRSKGRRKYLQDLRNWADAKGMKNKLYPEYPVYLYKGGVRGGIRKDYYQYAQWLIDQFEAERNMPLMAAS